MSQIPRTNSQNRLKLQRLNSNSSQYYNKDKKIEEQLNLEQEKTEKTCDSSEEDDSLADFRSPKSPQASESKPKFKVEVRSPKCRKKLLSSSKSKSKTTTRKKVREKNQPAIQSSFFKNKLEDVATVFVCPLCLKPSKDEDNHKSHIKFCANKNKVAPKDLLDAIELQEKQAEERKALGLVSAPILQPSKKPNYARLKKFASDDPELQLALAISKSLHEAEQIEQLDEVEALAAAAGQPIIITSEEERRKTLQSFGFTTNKPILETNVRSKKKKHIGLTVLQTRSETDKKRILTERIAEVLVGNDSISQPNQINSSGSRKTLPLKSQLLQNIIQIDNPLWKSSGLIQVHCDYFLIDPVAKYFSPTKKHNLELKEYTSTQQTEQEPPLNPPEDTVQISSPNMENETKLTSSIIKRLENLSKLINYYSPFSDLLITTKYRRQIYVHQLMIHAHLPLLLDEMIPFENSLYPNIKHQINWNHVDQNVAMAFLEFLYCGRIKDNREVLYVEANLSDLRKLARKYGMKDLFQYLQSDVKKVPKVEPRKVEPRIEQDGTQSEDDIFEDDSPPQVAELKTENSSGEDSDSQPTPLTQREVHPGKEQKSQQNSQTSSRHPDKNGPESQSQAKSDESSGNQYCSLPVDFRENQSQNGRVNLAENESPDTGSTYYEPSQSQPNEISRVDDLTEDLSDNLMTDDESPSPRFNSSNVTRRKNKVPETETEVPNPYHDTKEEKRKRKELEKSLKEKSSSSEVFLTCESKNMSVDKGGVDEEDSLVVETPPRQTSKLKRKDVRDGEQPSTSKQGFELEKKSQKKKVSEEEHFIDLTEYSPPESTKEERKKEKERKGKGKDKVKEKEKEKEKQPSLLDDDDIWMKPVPSTSKDEPPRKKSEGPNMNLDDYLEKMEKVADPENSLTSVVKVLNPLARKHVRNKFIKSPNRDCQQPKRKAISMLEDVLREEEENEHEYGCARWRPYKISRKRSSRKKMVKKMKIFFENNLRRLAYIHREASPNKVEEDPKLAKAGPKSFKERSKNVSTIPSVPDSSQVEEPSHEKRVDSPDSIISILSTPEKNPIPKSTPAKFKDTPVNQNQTPRKPTETPVKTPSKTPKIRSVVKLNQEVRIILSPVSVPHSTPKLSVVPKMASLDTTFATQTEDEIEDPSQLSLFENYKRTKGDENSINVYREAVFDKLDDENHALSGTSSRSKSQVVSSGSSAGSPNFLTRKRSAPEDSSEGSKKARVEQKKEDGVPRRTSPRKRASNLARLEESALEDSFAQDPESVKYELKKRKIKDLGTSERNTIMLKKVVKEEQENDISEPGTPDDDDSETGLTMFMDVVLECEETKKSKGEKTSEKTTVPIKEAFKKILELSEELKDDVLTYKPIELDVIVALFKSIGFKYQKTEILEFVEDECITLTKKWKRNEKKQKN